MSKYLCKVTEVYRVDSEDAAAALIDEAKRDRRFTLLKSSTDYKTIKEKKEIVEEYWLTTLVKEFTDSKMPDCTVSVEYDVKDGFFPSPISSYNDNDNEEDEDEE